MPPHLTISDGEFSLFRRLIYELCGINLTPVKKALVQNRLARRLHHYDLPSFGDYYTLVTKAGNREEIQIMIDLITTNETHFFREPDHYRHLGREILKAHDRKLNFRIWCGAASSGEEPYSLGMVLDDHLGDGPWEIIASDISTRMLDSAARGIYPLEKSVEIPRYYLQKYCLRGKGKQEGTFTIDERIYRRIKFMQVNLIEALPPLGEFDCIFIRNVFIYFARETQLQIVRKILPHLRKSGHLFLGHSESTDSRDLNRVIPAVYQKK